MVSSCLLQSAQDVLEARCDLFASEMMMTRNVSGDTQVLNILVSSNIQYTVFFTCVH